MKWTTAFGRWAMKRGIISNAERLMLWALILVCILVNGDGDITIGGGALGLHP